MGRGAARLPQGAEGTLGCTAEAGPVFKWQLEGKLSAPWQAPPVQGFVGLSSVGRVGSGAAPGPGEGDCSSLQSLVCWQRALQGMWCLRAPASAAACWARLCGVVGVICAGSGD